MREPVRVTEGQLRAGEVELLAVGSPAHPAAARRRHAAEHGVGCTEPDLDGARRLIAYRVE
ncbi:hypothetical protein [Prauserella shujinwangii]|uniref:hypothetical protein n=1 Tax=Prauserella shujinwangii TaxID=1453103 RepID=UPI0011B1EA93|nr:hypothetical protein [Prauserella shujinwangii]